MVDLNDTASGGERFAQDSGTANDVQLVGGQNFGCDGVIGRGGTHVSAKRAVFGDSDVIAGKSFDDGPCGGGTHGAEGNVGFVLDGLCDGRGNFAVEFFGLQFFVLAQTV